MNSSTPQQKKRSAGLEKLAPHHLRAAVLVWQKMSSAEIAEECGVSVDAVKHWRIDPLFKAEVDRLTKRFQCRTEAEIWEVTFFQAEVRRRTHELFEYVSGTVLRLLEEMDDQARLRNMGTLVRVFKDATELTLTADDTTMGLQDLASEVDAFKAKD